MKQLILWTAVVLSWGFFSTVGNAASDENQSLVCTSGAGHEKFSVVLERVWGDHGIEYVATGKAWIQDNFASAALICAGHKLEDIACVGFWFDQPGMIAKVSVRSVDGHLEASHESLEGSPVPNHGPWPCAVTKE